MPGLAKGPFRQKGSTSVFCANPLPCYNFFMDESFHQQVERARRMSGNEKVRESLQIFERTSQLMMDGLRNEFPSLPEQQLLQKLYERLEINRTLDW